MIWIFFLTYISEHNIEKYSLWPPVESYMPTDIGAMTQARTTTKNKHLPPDLHLSSDARFEFLRNRTTSDKRQDK